MAEVIFNYNGTNINIECNITNKMKDIITIFLKKVQKLKDNDFEFLYNDKKFNMN